MKQVIIYTDGACRGNPGPGGWGALIKFETAEKEIFGGQPDTTNNQMELSAAIEGLAVLKSPVALSFSQTLNMLWMESLCGFKIGKKIIGELLQKKMLRIKSYGKN